MVATVESEAEGRKRKKVAEMLQQRSNQCSSGGIVQYEVGVMLNMSIVCLHPKNKVPDRDWIIA